MYGAQAGQMQEYIHELFENDVEMYGAQAQPIIGLRKPLFENDVEMYGAQAGATYKAPEV